jgi:hypothetical protein
VERMLIVDDIALFPIRSILWIFRELHHAVQKELANEADTITAELTELYKMLETGTITEGEFESREKDLLDRLEAIEARTAHIREEEHAEIEEKAESVEKEAKREEAVRA